MIRICNIQEEIFGKMWDYSFIVTCSCLVLVYVTMKKINVANDSQTIAQGVCSLSHLQLSLLSVSWNAVFNSILFIAHLLLAMGVSVTQIV